MAGATSEYTGGQRTNRKVKPDAETRMAFMEGASDPARAKAESSGIQEVV